MIRKMYHTQEKRDTTLTSPCICVRDDAWLGEGHYYWYNEEDACIWGKNSKKRTGFYEVFISEINCEDVLDTVFNEEHYLFWLKQIEKVALKIVKATGEKPSLKELNDYFKERGTWTEVSGIMFQDLPNYFNLSMVKPIQYGEKKRTFNYKKRIQLVVYNLKIVLTFAPIYSDSCK